MNKGVFAIIGIWLTMGLIPLFEILPWSPLQIVFLRGLSGVFITILFFIYSKSIPKLPEKNLIICCFMFFLATFSLFQSASIWGSNLSAVMLDMAVLVPMIIAIIFGKPITRIDIGVFIVAILGTVLALRVWSSDFNVYGLLWGGLALIANGLFMYFASKVRSTNETEKVFYLSIGLMLGGALLWDNVPSLNNGEILLTILLSFGIGYFNFLFSFIALKKLGAVNVGLFVLGVTPAIILSSYIFLDKKIGIDQQLGIVLILLSLAFKVVTGKKAKEEGN